MNKLSSEGWSLLQQALPELATWRLTAKDIIQATAASRDVHYSLALLCEIGCGHEAHRNDLVGCTAGRGSAAGSVLNTELRAETPKAVRRRLEERCLPVKYTELKERAPAICSFSTFASLKPLIASSSFLGA